MFVDRVAIEAHAGDGGHGCVSFRREKYIPKGGPDGGDGGKGGDIVLVVDSNVNNLVAFKYQPIQRAKRGEHGMGKQRYGRAAPDIICRVPPGTVVYQLPDQPFGSRVETSDDPLDEPLPSDDEVDGPAPRRGKSVRALDPHRDNLPLVADLAKPGTRFVLCKGGKGGRGNMRFKSSTNQAPRRADPGGKGEEGRYLLELKTIADVGLVGFPNAGKSSLLGSLSAARPRVAAFPFTTLRPHVGVVEMDGYYRFSVADIPGLVEGAHQGVGLGHDFLRHIERCKILLFVLDMAGTEGRNPVEDFQQVRAELKLFRSDLANRPTLIAANKMDLPEAAAHLKAFRRRFRRPILPISAQTGDGIEPLKQALRHMLEPDAPG